MKIAVTMHVIKRFQSMSHQPRNEQFDLFIYYSIIISFYNNVRHGIYNYYAHHFSVGGFRAAASASL